MLRILLVIGARQRLRELRGPVEVPESRAFERLIPSEAFGPNCQRAVGEGGTVERGWIWLGDGAGAGGGGAGSG